MSQYMATFSDSHLLNVGPRLRRCLACLSVNLWVFCFLLYFIPRSKVRATVICDTPYFLSRSRWRVESAQSMTFATLLTSLFVRTSDLPWFALEKFPGPLFFLYWWYYWLFCCKLKFLVLHDFKKWYTPKTRPLMNLLVFLTIFKDQWKSFF